MNIEALEQLKAWLLAGAPDRHFDMGFLIDPDQFETQNWCGTSCCMAGYVATALSPEKPHYIDEVEFLACEHLGLNPSLGNALFYPKVYPQEYRSVQETWPDWFKITTQQAAQAVQNVIDRQNPHWEEIFE